MVYAHKVKKVTLSGTMFGGQEVWSTGFFLGKENADATAPTQEEADAIRDAWAVFFNDSGSKISTHYAFTGLKLASLDTAGHTIQEEVIYSYPTTPVLGASATGTLPPQCTVVCTLFTDRPRGRASKGRMYLPGIAEAISSSGKIGATTMSTLPTELQQFFNTIRSSFDVPDQVILASKGVGAFPALTAQNEPIIGIRVGDVIDTQRRRRNGLQEVYTTRLVTN